jgi:hypothetical protein
VDGDSLCINHLDSPLGPLDAVVAELNDAKVRTEEGMRCFLPHDGETLFQFGLFQCRSLRTDTHAEVIPFGSTCEPPVYLEGVRVSSGHRCNEEGRAECSTEEPGLGLDRIHIALGKSVMDQPHVPETGVAGLDGFLTTDVEVIPFP